MKQQVILLVFIVASCHSFPSTIQREKRSSSTCFQPPVSCNRTRYRSLDGSCNNLEQPGWGAPFLPYHRLLSHSYADGLSAFPRSSSGNELLSARKISTQLHADKQIVDQVWNLNAMQWGQIVAHDMSLTDNNALISECCDNNRIPSTAADTAHCEYIPLPEDDPLHGPLGNQCLNFMRTGTTWQRECSGQDTPAEQITVVTAYMDLSLVYGNSDEDVSDLRTGAGGRLASAVRDGQEYPPQHPNVASGCPFALSTTEPCYQTGDARANQSPHLIILQIVLMREHNRIADALAELNPEWSDEKLFQEARRINVATFQHINYYEYLPILLGHEHMVEHKLIYPDAEGYINDYNAAVNPSIAVEHASGAFRFFHSQIQGFLQLATETREVEGALRLSDWINRPLVLELENGFNDLVRGFTAQPQGLSDQYYAAEVTEFMFRTNNNSFGTDLRALDIQRARDHGLGKYVTARALCELPVPSSFEDMSDYISAENIKILKSIYETPYDVELVVAAALEKSVPGAQAGPTFLCILTDQFYRTRVGDRFFYENGADRSIAFSLSQLRSIRQGASMARLLCDNVKDVELMQPKAFQILRDNNQLGPCEDLPAVDLSLWKES